MLAALAAWIEKISLRRLIVTGKTCLTLSLRDRSKMTRLREKGLKQVELIYVKMNFHNGHFSLKVFIMLLAR